jgi:restriction system protein
VSVPVPRLRLRLRLKDLRPHRPRTPQDKAAAAATVLFAAAAVWQVRRVLAAALLWAWWFCPLLLAGSFAVRAVRWRRRVLAERARAARLARLRLPLAVLDGLDPTAFEYAVRDLMIRDGIAARHVGRQGDQAADAIGKDPCGRTWVAQCKHTTVAGKVGVHVMYQVKGTAEPVHGADVAVVVTNGSFTRDAMAWGDEHKVHWIDRPRLRAWAEEGTSLHEILCVTAAVRR